MSLVGSEVDISIDTGGGSVPSKNVVSDDDDDELSVPQNLLDSNDCVMDQHPPPTPPRPAEQLFLNDLSTQNISAAALAQQIHLSLRSPGASRISVNTDDFVTAHGSFSPNSNCEGFDLPDTPGPLLTSTTYNSDLSSPFAINSNADDDQSSCDDDNSNKHSNNVFEKDALSRNYRYVINPEEELELFQDASMSTKVAPTTTKLPAASTPPSMKKEKFFPTEAPAHVDAAEKVYDTAKGVWAWGKGVMIVSPFLGLAEGVAGKAAEMTGHSLENIDGEVVKQLHGIDDGILNPAIEKIVGIILGAAGKSEDVLGPVIVALLKPFGLIKDSAENPEQTPVAGVNVSKTYN